MKEQKIILITGADRGIGRAIAEALASPHRTLLLHYHHNQKMAQETRQTCLAQGADCVTYAADIRDFQEVTAMFQQIESRFHGVDVLINNAGVSVYGLAQDMKESDWAEIFDTNARGTFLCCQNAIPHMVRQQWGRIINMSSMWGQAGASCESLYAASKGAIDALTKSLAKELIYSHITVNAIAPGAVDTDMLALLSPEDQRALKEELPMGRFLRPEEIAYWVKAIVEEEGGALTGQIISPNGGLVI